MPHSVSLIATVAAAFGLALVLGFVAARLRMPALVGYLLAGIIIGPATPGFVADVDIAGQLAEIGVMLLMFGVGLHFSLSDLMAVRRIAVIATPDTVGVRTMVGNARTLNPNIEVVVRTHNEEEAALLERDGCGRIFFGEQELARAMTQYVVDRLPRAG